MRKYLLAILITLTAASLRAQIPDTGSFILHKFAQAIGRESYTITHEGTNETCNVDFLFTDRSTKVPLKASLRTTNDLQPLALAISGRSSRMTRINDSITISGSNVRIKVNDSAYSAALPPMAFPVTGYAPVTFQMLLLEYWKLNGRPSAIPLLPSGSVTIRRDGIDTLWEGHPIYLERYVISGLIWGNEFVWTDLDGQLACLVSIDAEFDKFEATGPHWESALPGLLKKAAVYGMRLFPGAHGQSGNLALTGGTLIDVVGGHSTPNATVLVSNGRIVSAGTGIAIPSGYTRKDVTGKTILPGLWDMHAHFEQVEWGPAYIGAGITTVRDCGNEFEFINAVKQSIDAGEGIGPHILKAGIIDGHGPMALGIIQAGDASEAVKAVDRYKANGFVQIKIYSSVKPEVVKAICDEAHRVGLTVTGHIPEGMTLLQGVDSGMDMVNHIPYVAAVLHKGKDFSIDFSDPKNVEVIRFLKDHHTVVDPTLAVYEIGMRSLQDSITRIEPNYYTLPPVIQTLYVNSGTNPKTAAFERVIFRSWQSIVKALQENGIPIVTGTDECLPGYSLYRELELYVQAGLTPMEALRAATIVPARVMKMEDRTGSVTAGKTADLIVVDGDPLQDISQIRKVSLVIKDGVVYDPVAVHRLVGFNL